MSTNHDTDFDSSARIAQDHTHVESAELPPHASMPVQPAPASAADILPPASAHRIRGRGNTPVRTAMLQRMQQTYGNRSLQRFLSAQRSASSPVVAEEEDIAGRIGSRSGQGNALDPGTQSRLEGGLGTDLSGVRVHTDGEADHLARSVDATAFTTGNDIFFRHGAYDPGSERGMHLLAHEATHTVQQSRGPVAGTPQAGGVSVSDPSDQYEQAAERAAHNVLAGQPAGLDAPPGAASAQVQREAVPEEEEEEEPVQKMPSGVSIQRHADGDEEA